MMKDSEDDCLCGQVVLNHETGAKYRFHTEAEAKTFAAKHNKKIQARAGMAPRFFCYAPDALPVWYLKLSEIKR